MPLVMMSEDRSDAAVRDLLTEPSRNRPAVTVHRQQAKLQPGSITMSCPPCVRIAPSRWRTRTTG